MPRDRLSSEAKVPPSSERAICAGVPDIRPLGIPPVNVGLGCAHWAGPGFVVDSVWLIGGQYSAFAVVNIGSAGVVSRPDLYCVVGALVALVEGCTGNVIHVSGHKKDGTLALAPAPVLVEAAPVEICEGSLCRSANCLT